MTCSLAHILFLEAAQHSQARVNDLSMTKQSYPSCNLEQGSLKKKRHPLIYIYMLYINIYVEPTDSIIRGCHLTTTINLH